MFGMGLDMQTQVSLVKGHLQSSSGTLYCSSALGNYSIVAGCVIIAIDNSTSPANVTFNQTLIPSKDNQTRYCNSYSELLDLSITDLYVGMNIDCMATSRHTVECAQDLSLVWNCTPAMSVIANFITRKYSSPEYFIASYIFLILSTAFLLLGIGPFNQYRYLEKIGA